MLSDYTQCLLVKLNASNISTTAFIPNKFAVLNNHVRLTDTENPIDIWVIKEIYQTISSEDLLHLKQARRSLI